MHKYKDNKHKSLDYFQMYVWLSNTVLGNQEVPVPRVIIGSSDLHKHIHSNHPLSSGQFMDREAK